MKQHISLRQANQNFSRYIEAVERGQEFIVTRRGKPVAVISPAPRRGIRRLSLAQKAALKRLFASARPLAIKKWRREELYEDV
jgi:prevent-host-death family protein